MTAGKGSKKDSYAMPAKVKKITRKLNAIFGLSPL
ncbi:MAG: hypothetical protein ACI87N_003170 [Flavobacteriales bacterium]|jgi:hypothetical protein